MTNWGPTCINKISRVVPFPQGLGGPSQLPDKVAKNCRAPMPHLAYASKIILQAHFKHIRKLSMMRN